MERMIHLKVNFKRCGAYIIDLIIVTVIAVIVSNICSPRYQLDNYNKSFNKLIELTKKYEDEEIKEKEYQKEYRKLSYDLDKNSTTTSFVLLGCMIGYFGIFQYSQDGKTLGKRLFKLQVVKNNDGELNIGHYLLRSIVLYNILFSVAKLILLYCLKQSTYMNYRDILFNVQSIIQLIILLSIFISKERRGLHDYIAGTKVIDLNTLDEFANGKKVIEGEVVK